MIKYNMNDILATSSKSIRSGFIQCAVSATLDRHVRWALFLTFVCILLIISTVAAHASVAYTDDAAKYTDSYAGKTIGLGFGPFIVTAENDKPPFAGTFLGDASGTEKNSGSPNPGSINTNGHSFGFYANGGPAASVMISRAFKFDMHSPGDSFSINFVTGFNETGTAGITLYTNNGSVGNFVFVAGQGFKFDGKPTGIAFRPGALHLLWTITATGKLKFTCDGAVSYTGVGAMDGPIIGFKVYATNSGPGGSDHDGYFNSMNEIVQP